MLSSHRDLEVIMHNSTKLSRRCEEVANMANSWVAHFAPLQQESWCKPLAKSWVRAWKEKRFQCFFNRNTTRIIRIQYIHNQSLFSYVTPWFLEAQAQYAIMLCYVTCIFDHRVLSCFSSVIINANRFYVGLHVLEWVQLRFKKII